MTKKEAVEVVALVATIYPVPVWAIETMEAYADFIDDLDFEKAMKGVHAWIRTEKNRPTIADIRRGAAEAERGGFVG